MGPGNLSATAAAASSRHDELPDRFRNAVKYPIHNDVLRKLWDRIELFPKGS
jgi:hypothetical protein